MNQLKQIKMRSLLTGVTFFVLASLALPTASYAYYQVDSNKPGVDATVASAGGAPADYQVLANRRIRALIQKGTGVPTVAKGFGDDVPLNLAVEMLMPDGWVAYVKPGIDKGTKVSWFAGQKWTDALEQISAQKKLSTTVDWDAKTVTVDPMPADDGLSKIQAGTAIAGVQDPTTNVSGVYRRPQNVDAKGQPVDGPLKTYTSLQEFLNEQIEVDLRHAPVQDAILAMLPRGWSVDVSAVQDKIAGINVDLTTTESRGTAIGLLMRQLNMMLYPYPKLNKAVLADIGSQVAQ